MPSPACYTSLQRYWYLKVLMNFPAKQGGFLFCPEIEWEPICFQRAADLAQSFSGANGSLKEIWVEKTSCLGCNTHCEIHIHSISFLLACLPAMPGVLISHMYKYLSNFFFFYHSGTVCIGRSGANLCVKISLDISFWLLVAGASFNSPCCSWLLSQSHFSNS